MKKPMNKPDLSVNKKSYRLYSGHDIKIDLRAVIAIHDRQEGNYFVIVTPKVSFTLVDEDYDRFCSEWEAV